MRQSRKVQSQPIRRKTKTTHPPCRVVIEAVSPQLDAGRFPIKRAIGDSVVVEADMFADGHESLSCRLLFRSSNDPAWTEQPMVALGNDRWQASFRVDTVGQYLYTLMAWVDDFGSWRRDLAKRLQANQDVYLELLIGEHWVDVAAQRAHGKDARQMKRMASQLRTQDAGGHASAIECALSAELAECMDRYPDRRSATAYEKTLKVLVYRQKARFSAWYEMFPRSCSPQPYVHGTLKGCESRLKEIASMGFDVLYLPPIHPIGMTHRKGKNNAAVASAQDPGSPWAIGSPDAGHLAVDPRLGTLEDFRSLMQAAKRQGLEIALDLAFQCSPDHPYVKEHPEWFHIRPDGTIQHAENPPKKYEDIYPLNFESPAWQSLWAEMERIVRFWIEQGIRIFRVDNPHTKPFAFWEWLINRITRDYPDVIFLSEAFTRPKIMYQLAKLGFTQSYTYFTWRNSKAELTQYFTELTQAPVREFFWPNLWPNTPDILHAYLQTGGRPAFMVRLILAATLGSNYGIYGPAFEWCESRPREAGSEEYLDSEKYELRAWDRQRPDSLCALIARINAIRRQNPALQRPDSLQFHSVDNERLIAYSKRTEEGANRILVVVNLDPHATQSGWLDFSIEAMGLDPSHPYQVHDLLSDARYLWQGHRNYVELNPHLMPAHIFRIRRRQRSEQDFDYYD